MTLLDTDTLTLLYFNNPVVRARLAAATDLPVGVTVVSRAQLLQGRFDAILTADTPERLAEAQVRLDKTDALLAEFPPAVLLDLASAARYFRLRALPKIGRRGRADLTNAALAIALGATLVSRNVRDYEGVPNLKFDTW